MSAYNPVLYLEPDMMLELAMGLEPAFTIVQKYNFDLKEFVKIQNLPWFADALMRERERLRDEGFTWQAKARLMNESLLQDLFVEAKTLGMKPEMKLELSKHLADMTGTRKPVQTGPSTSGPQFQITITLPDNPRGPVNVKDMIEGQRSETAPMVIDMSPPARSPLSPIASLFKLSNDLAGPPL